MEYLIKRVLERGYTIPWCMVVWEYVVVCTISSKRGSKEGWLLGASGVDTPNEVLFMGCQIMNYPGFGVGPDLKIRSERSQDPWNDLI